MGCFAANPAFLLVKTTRVRVGVMLHIDVFVIIQKRNSVQLD
jgi:hypothetical protein